MNIGEWLSRRAVLHPEKEAVVFGEVRLTYRELNERSNRCAHALEALGIGPGDRVAIYSLNSNQFIETVFACAKIGAIVVPLNVRLSPPEIEYILKDSGAEAIVAGSDLVGMIEGILRAAEIKHLIIVGDAALEKSHAFESLLEGRSCDDPCLTQTGDQDGAVFLMYTSGTTGKPKGAIITHTNLFWNSLNCMHGFRLDADTRFLVSVPLFHAGGLNGGVIPTIYAGGTVILEPFFNPQATLELVQKERITFLGGVPVMFQMILDVPDFDTYDLSSIKTIMAGAMPVPVPLIEAYREKNITFQQCYGLTEATTSVLYLRHEDALRKVGSVGKPFFHVEVRIVKDDGSPAGPGEVGEILVKGGNVMRGYWGWPEETARTIRDGWLHTGDMATVDEEGYVFIVDRKKDIIISGGENIYPAEVEEVLSRHPKVQEVGVIAAEDPKWGESVRAVIVPKAGQAPTLEEITAFCESRLARFKHPRSLVLVDEIPRNALGKILRRILRERYGRR